MNFKNVENQKEKSQLTLREYMINYNLKRWKKGLNSEVYEQYQEIQIPLFRQKIMEFYKYIR